MKYCIKHCESEIIKGNGMSSNIIYEISDDNQYRYALGLKGNNPLYCFGINPNTATPEDYDLTMKKLRKVAQLFGFNSYVMLNIYPLRTSSPKDLPETINYKEHTKNVKIILEKIINGTSIWAAWGDSINVRPWLNTCLANIIENIEKKKKNINWLKMGDLTNALNPRHPSRLKYQEFTQLKLLSH